MNEKSARKLQLSRRIDGIHPAAAWSIRVASIVFALIVGGLLLLALGYSPLKAYGTIIDGSLGSKTFVRQTIKIAIPLLGCALAIAPCFKMHFWNIGAEGQITAGAIGATFFALKFGKTMPQLPLLLIMAVAAILCGGLWALIPAFFKAKWNTNETLFTLMMNYIIIGVVKWRQPDDRAVCGQCQAAVRARRALRLDHCTRADGPDVHLHALHKARLRDRRHW